jgi:probable HAF family extracellular repeat protein
MAAAWLATAWAAHALTFEPLGHVGGLASEPTAVSANGRVVVGGVSTQVNEETGEPYGTTKSFRWNAGAMQSPVPACSPGPNGSRVSDDGGILPGCFATLGRPAVWENGTVREVSTDSGLYLYDVSGDGFVLFGDRPHIIQVPFGDDLDYKEAVRFVGGVVTPLGFLPGDNWSEVIAVSRDGSVAAVKSQLREDTPEDTMETVRAARWNGGGLQDLGTLGASDVFATDVSSDGGTIVGYLEYDVGEQVRAFRWTESTGMVDLGFPPGGDGARARGVSSDGRMIVGSWGPPTLEGPRAMIWTAADGPRDLQDLLVDDFGYDLGGWRLIEATAVSSDASTVAGIGVDPATGYVSGWIASLNGVLVVDLEIFDNAGNPIEGQLTVDESLQVELTVTNKTGTTLRDFRFARGEALVIDDRSPGGLAFVAGPTPDISAATFTLAEAESATIRYRVTAQSAGLAAAHSKMTATGDNGVEYTDAHSLRFDIQSREAVAAELEQYLITLALERALTDAFRRLHQEFRERGEAIRAKLAATLKSSNVAKFFANAGLSNLEHTLARQTATAAEMINTRLPDGPIRGFTAEELQGQYNKSFRKELGKGVSDWLDGWASLGGKAKRAAQASFAEGLLGAEYFLGTATQSERQEFVARMCAIANARDQPNSAYQKLKTKYVDFVARGGGLNAIVEGLTEEAVAQLPGAIYGAVAFAADDRLARKKILKLAEKDPVGFQREWARQDAAIANKFMPLLLDTLVGGTVVRGFAKGKGLLQGAGSSISNSGRAAGVLDEAGSLVDDVAARIAVADDALPPMTGLDAARTSEAFLSNLEGATVVQAGDLGRVYELPNLGGVPEITLDAKAGILRQLEAEYAAGSGQEIRLAEVLKPSSALRKDGGLAKLELTEQKTGKAEMLDAGMPGDALGEANVWRSTTPPSELKDFGTWSKPRQDAATKSWNKANADWENWHNPTDPKSKTFRLRECCLGKKGRTPLDLEPNKAGIQRFVTAEFEEVSVLQGGAEAKLIRVKEYTVEVVDTNRGVSVNSRNVVARSDVARPQTPDADAVALAKVVGTDAQGRPILQPLGQAERDYILKRYVDKNIKARRSKLIPDNAEHGVTLVMDDAGALAAGKLIPQYGAPFLPSEVGEAYLRRIAPFVTANGKTVEETLEAMLKLVQGEGGFGQSAVVVTRDSRYFGELAVSNW